MTKQLFSEGLLKMAGIPLEEEPRKILEPRRVEDTEEKKKQAEYKRAQEEYKRVAEIIKQSEGRIGKLKLAYSKLTELPEGIISVKGLFLEGSSIQKLPKSLKKVGRLDLELTDIAELPVDLEVRDLRTVDCKYLKKIPSYISLELLIIFDSTVEEIGEYPKLEWLSCEDTPFAEKAKQEAQVQGMDVKEYIRQKHKLPKDCEVYI